MKQSASSKAKTGQANARPRKRKTNKANARPRRGVLGWANVVKSSIISFAGLSLSHLYRTKPELLAQYGIHCGNIEGIKELLALCGIILIGCAAIQAALNSNAMKQRMDERDETMDEMTKTMNTI